MTIWKTFPALCALGLLAGCGGPVAEEAAPTPETGPREFWAYFGTYTRETSQGIYRSRFDAATGALGDAQLVAEIENPSFLTIHPNKRFLYVVTETSEGSVSSFVIEDSGGLTLINTQPANGSLPCDLEVDHTGRMLVVANYASGSTIAYSIAEDGALSAPTSFHQHEGSSVHERQEAPHAHSVDFTADNRYVVVADLGTDKLVVYQAEPAEGRLTPISEAALAPGSGPRHFAFHPSERFGYALGELASTVTAMTYADGRFEAIQSVSTLPEDFAGGNSTAEIAVHPSGKFLYGSNRGHDSIAVFSVDEASGKIERTAVVKSGGQTPRNFAIDPTGRYILAANQKSDNVVVFTIDQQTGGLTPRGTEITVDAPVCVQFQPIPATG